MTALATCDDDVAGRCRRLVDDALGRLLGGEAPLERLMAEAALAGGRRIRATLTLLACRTAGGVGEEALPLACAVEMIHAASLVLDDLPAMDDHRLRRGRPALHRRHGEAVAILAAVALLARAFEVAGRHDAERGTASVPLLAAAVGAAGMCGGQLADLAVQGASDTVGDTHRLEALHAAKTGRLMAAACEAGAIAGGAGADARRAFAAWGLALGTAYQIADDVADREADAAGGRPNWASLAGASAARARVAALLDAAATGLRDAGFDAAMLDAYGRSLVAGAAERRRGRR
ncbi:MAG: polyprenyl synthetase family protein [Alphaproteobacteria bacterium]